MSVDLALPQVALSMPRAELKRLCLAHGSVINSAGCTGPDGKPLDGPRLLWAMAGRESSFGANLRPRHEPQYDVGGHYAKKPEVIAGLAKYGPAFACSYGPLQVLAVNAFGFSPRELAAYPETALIAAIGYMGRYVFGHCRATTLEQIARTWNGGHPHAETTPGYVQDVQKYYEDEVLSDGTPA